MTRLPLALAVLAATLLRAAPAGAVPENGLYYLSIPGAAGNIQAVAPQGVVQVDYVPVLERLTSGQMQVLQAALRIPAPIFEAPLSLRGLLGYRQLWAFYDGSSEDTYGGVEAGLSAALPLSVLPWIGGLLSPVGLYAFGFHNQLITAKANGQGFGTQGLALPSYGAGMTLNLPSNSVLTLGYESWATPQELGTGSTTFSSGLRTFNGLTVGYRW